MEKEQEKRRAICDLGDASSSSLFILVLLVFFLPFSSKTSQIHRSASILTSSQKIDDDGDVTNALDSLLSIGLAHLLSSHQ